MRKVLNKRKLFYFITLLILSVLLLILSVKLVIDFTSNKSVVESKNEIDSIELYGYKLHDNSTEIYKKYFMELKDVLKSEEVDNDKYVSLIAKLFVIDFYTLDNKLTSTDIGGTVFLHDDFVDNFILNAENTIYSSVKSNIYGDREQILPIVKDVSILAVVESSYEYNNKKYDAYEVECNWEYVEDLGYESSAKYIFIKDNGKYNLVEN